MPHIPELWLTIVRYSLIMCGIYYWAWIHAIPKWRGYRIRQEMLILENGARANKLVKVPLSELAQWDREHDATGRKLDARQDDESDGGSDNTQVQEERQHTKNV